jgi:hypothetical protein
MGEPCALGKLPGRSPDDLVGARLGHSLLPSGQCTRTRATRPTWRGVL